MVMVFSYYDMNLKLCIPFIDKFFQFRGEHTEPWNFETLGYHGSLHYPNDVGLRCGFAISELDL